MLRLPSALRPGSNGLAAGRSSAGSFPSIRRGMQRQARQGTDGTAAAAGPPPAAVAYVYSGPGAGARSLLSALQSLREALLPEVQVQQLGPEQLLEGGWQEGCALLVMPGGADLPYCARLDGRGNQLIREFVKGGGSYLGLCAGAYYASARVEFELGSRLEVVGDRELAFFPGVAAGGAFPGFSYESEVGAAAARLVFRPAEHWAPPPQHQQAQHQQAQHKQAQQQEQEQQQQQQQLETQQGKQQEPQQLAADGGWLECWDYLNGGPTFRLQTGTFPSEGAAAALPAQLDQQQQTLHKQPSDMRAAGISKAAAGLAAAGVQLLAAYADLGGAPAALLCMVGSGRAVLCGTHPELAPSWLGAAAEAEGGAAEAADGVEQLGGGASAPAVGSSSVGGSSAVSDALGAVAAAVAATAPAGQQQQQAAASSAAHVRRLRQQLQSSQRQREALWRSLLAAAGLGPFLQPPPS